MINDITIGQYKEDKKQLEKNIEDLLDAFSKKYETIVNVNIDVQSYGMVNTGITISYVVNAEDEI